MPFNVEAKYQDKIKNILIPIAGPTLLDFLYQSEIPVKSSCSGKGICHQCRVKVNTGVASVSIQDRKAFDSEQIKEGWRLSCQLRPRTQMSVQIPQVFYSKETVEFLRDPTSDWWLVLDLGTTGIEINAIDQDGVWMSVKELNSQVRWGADIMTRLHNVMNGKGLDLKNVILKQIDKILNIILQKNNNQKYMGKLFVAGNSAMISILHEWPIESLATSPFQPYSTEEAKIQLQNFGEITTLPLLASFIGGDLWAGLVYLKKMDQFENTPWMLIDVGTNSEIILWSGQNLFVTSTPAGPAFEGSNISIGMRAEPGAIINLKLNEDKNWVFDVIGNDIPIGICGSTLIDLIDQSVEAGFLTDDGEIKAGNEIKINRTLSLNQNDVREFQLAKSALKTGIEILEKVSLVQPNKIFLAGNFGSHLSIQSVKSIDMFPDVELKVIGNSSLKGTICWSQMEDQEKLELTQYFKSKIKFVELSLRDDFQDSFVKNMKLRK